MLNFYLVFAGYDKVTHAGRATTWMRKIKAPSLQTKIIKNEGHSQNMGFNGKTVWRYPTKKMKYRTRLIQKWLKNTSPRFLKRSKGR